MTGIPRPFLPLEPLIVALAVALIPMPLPWSLLLAVPIVFLVIGNLRAIPARVAVPVLIGAAVVEAIILIAGIAKRGLDDSLWWAWIVGATTAGICIWVAIKRVREREV